MDEDMIERQGKIHPTAIDLTPGMYDGYKQLRGVYRKLEKKYWGFWGVRFGSKKRQEIEPEDLTALEELRSSLSTLSSHYIRHERIHLNGQAQELQLKIHNFLRCYQTPTTQKSTRQND